MRFCWLLLLCSLSVDAAQAEQIAMTCKNARREYLVVYDSFARSLTAKADEGDTPYRVDSIKVTGGETVISGATTADGPLFKATIGRSRSITFLQGGKVLQVDKCR